MKKYKGAGKEPGVARYELLADGIIIAFKTGEMYLYDYNRPGKVHVDNMKKHALEGSGLTTYINQHVRENYAAKLNG